MFGRTVPNRTVQSSAISSAEFGNKSHIVRPYKVRQLVRQSSVINLGIYSGQEWPGKIAFSSGVKPGASKGRGAGTCPYSLHPPTKLGRPSSLRAYLPSDHIGLEGKRLQLQPLSPLGEGLAWGSPQARLSFDLGLSHCTDPVAHFHKCVCVTWVMCS